MADRTLSICDRCTKTIPLPRRYRTRIRWSRAPERRPPFDLCQSCRAELSQWLGLLSHSKPEPEVVENDQVAPAEHAEAEALRRAAEIIDATPRRTVERLDVETTSIIDATRATTSSPPPVG